MVIRTHFNILIAKLNLVRPKKIALSARKLPRVIVWWYNPVSAYQYKILTTHVSIWSNIEEKNGCLLD